MIGIAFVLIFFGLMVLFGILERRRTSWKLRTIPAFSRLLRAIGLAVEDGSRLHISIGRGNLTGPSSAAAFVGLSMLDRIARVTSESDRLPVSSSGDGALAILTQDTLRSAYRDLGASERYDPKSGRLTGLTPFSYAAGTLPLIQDEMISASVLAGNFGSEVALITDIGERSEGFTLAGTDNVPAQAILYGTANEPLIGEELYAGGAYLRAGLMHVASLRAQDVIRWLVIAIILGGGILRFLGVNLEGMLP